MKFLVYLQQISDLYYMENEKLKRITIIDGVLSKGNWVSFQEIAIELNKVLKKVKFETNTSLTGRYQALFHKDLKMIKEALKNETFGLPEDMLQIKGGNRNRVYRYKEKGFSVLSYIDYRFSIVDQKNLTTALRYIESTLPQNVFDMVEFSMRSRVEYSYGDNTKSVDYGENLNLTGRHWLPIIYKSLNKTVLNICYKPYYDDSYTFKLCPYLLKQYNNRWFLFGWIDEIKRSFWKNPPKDIEKIDPNYWIVPIDRIEDVSICGGEEMLPRPKNYMDRFAPIIGITQQECDSQTTLPGKSQRITMGIYDINLWGRITTKPLHNSQTVLKAFDNGYGQIQIVVVPNVEFYDELMGLGKNIVVESPKSVRRKVVERLDSIKERYMK